MATSLKQVQASMNGDAKEAVLPIVESSLYGDNLTATPVLAERKYVVFKLVKKNVKRLTLDGICHNVMNPKTQVRETIRLIQGASSIWTTELTEMLKDKDYVKKNRIGIQFRDGVCRIGSHDDTMIEFARMNKNNVGKNRVGSGKYDYYEYDAAEEQQMRYDKQIKRINLIQRISEMEESRMIKLALFLGIKPYDEEIGVPKTANGYRTELLIKADTQPDIVAKYMDSREVDVAYIVRKAVMDAKIDLGGQTGNAIWAGSAGFICKIPQGRKPLEYLTELAMTNSRDGKQFLEQLEAIVT
jgi:hypothetical protein